MVRTLLTRALVATALLLPAAAVAESCPYYSADGTELRYVDDGDNTVLIQHANGHPEKCVWLRGGEDGRIEFGCEGKDIESFEDFQAAGSMVFRKERWEQRCFDYSGWDTLKRHPELRWSTSSVPPFPYDESWAGGYALRPVIDDVPKVTRVERITAALGSPDIDTEYETELVTLDLAGRVVQDMRMRIWLGGHGYVILKHRFEGNRFEKLAVRRAAILGLKADDQLLEDLRWQELAKQWVELNYPTISAWERVSKHDTPIPYDLANRWIPKYDELDAACRGESKSTTEATCEERDAVYSQIVDYYGFCLRRYCEANADAEWHICERDSYRN